MAKEKVYASGLRTFPPHPNAPEFILGTLLITPEELREWIQNNPQYMTEYKGSAQLKLSVQKGRDGNGITLSVDVWKKEGE